MNRSLAEQNHYPAIDVLASVSRLMPDVASQEHKAAAGKLRNVLATYRGAEDLINIGAYAEGSNAAIDFARSKIDQANDFLRQKVDDKAPYEQTVSRLTGEFGDGNS